MIFILNNWLYIFILMTFAWLLYLKSKNPGIIDVFWPISITFTAAYYTLIKTPSLSNIAFLAVGIFWCLRLAGHLFFTRIKPKLIEKRYDEFSKDWQGKKLLGFFIHYQLQGVLAIIIATPFIWIKVFNVTAIIGLTLIIIGIIGETIADMQLYFFKKQKKGPVCNTGLWRYSRHPNYFFEIVIWVGFAVAAITSNPWSFIALISPSLLTFIMVKITGPLTEKTSLESKGEAYVHYQKTTSFIIPWKKLPN